MTSSLRLREGAAADLPCLERMLFEAFFWDAAVDRPALAAFRGRAEFSKLLANWGRAGDRSLIAEAAGTPIGAAWFRLWTPEHCSYGFVDASTPELALAVHQRHRRQGVGRALLGALVARARDDGFGAVSLSVSPLNPARRLYEAVGFRRVGESGTSWTLCLSLRES